MKKYIKSNLKSLITTIIFSILASVFAVRVQFIKGDVLDYALVKSFNNTLRYGCYLGLSIVLELDFFYFYDIASRNFDNISFGYDNKEYLLNDLNMKFIKNRQYLLQGKSCSGKTTSMNLLLDYYKPNLGTIKINGAPVREIKNLNEMTTVMRQDVILFQDTLRNNITMYQNISDEPLANLDDKNAKSIESQLLSIKDRTLIIISHQFSSENMGTLETIVFDL